MSCAHHANEGIGPVENRVVNCRILGKVIASWTKLSHLATNRCMAAALFKLIESLTDVISPHLPDAVSVVRQVQVTGIISNFGTLLPGSWRFSLSSFCLKKRFR